MKFRIILTLSIAALIAGSMLFAGSRPISAQRLAKSIYIQATAMGQQT
jgi:hypothetical protein